MASRSGHRRKLKQLKRLSALPAAERDAAATQRLLARRHEVNRRAKSLDGPTVWSLANDPLLEAIAVALDPVLSRAM
jgi:hypothetical protein